MYKLLILLVMACYLMACSTSPSDPEGDAVVGVALGDSTTATVGNPAVGALVGN